MDDRKEGLFKKQDEAEMENKTTYNIETELSEIAKMLSKTEAHASLNGNSIIADLLMHLKYVVYDTSIFYNIIKVQKERE